MLACACAALAMVLGVVPASADPPGPNALPVHVVSVKTEDALNQAEALTTALKRAVQNAKGWSLAESKHSLEFLVVKMKCPEPIDAACETRIADVIKADRFIWSVIDFADKSEKTIKGTLSFFERGKGTNRAELSYSAVLDDPNMDALAKVARDAVDQVTGGPPKGALRVQSGGVAGQLFVDGKPLGSLPAEGTTVQLPSGEHTVMVRAPGYADAKANVVVKPVSTVDVAVTMVEVEQAKPIDGRMIGGFVSLGVGVAAGALGLWAALDVNGIRTDPRYDNYRAQVSESKSACDVARNPPGLGTVGADRFSDQEMADACDTADTRELIQAVAFPLAAVAAGVGVYLLGTSSLVGGGGGDAPNETAWKVGPVIGRDVQAVQVTYKF